MLDIFFKILLSFSKEIMIIPIVIIGYIYYDRKIFFHGVYLLFFSMVLNVALKVTFQHPLPAFLGKEGFCFPSGHMQTACVFYGWLWTFIHHQFFRILVPLGFIGIGFGLMHFGYHDQSDVMAAFFVAIFLVYAYRYFLIIKKVSEDQIILYITIFSAMCMIYAHIRYTTQGYALKLYVLHLASVLYYVFIRQKRLMIDK